MAIKQDIKEINTYAMAGSNSYLNLSQAEKLELLKKLISTTLALANPSGKARSRESVGRLVANFEDNFINFYTHEMGMSEKELAAFFATKLKDEKSLLSKDIPDYKNILTLVANIFKEVKNIEKETKGFDETTSMAELDSYLEKMFSAYKSAYAESSKMKRINELTTIEPIKFLAYIEKSIVTIEANIAIALKYGIPVSEYQNMLNMLRQLQSNPKQTFKMTNEEIKAFRAKVVATKRSLTIKIKQATTVIVNRIEDAHKEEGAAGIVATPTTPAQRTPDDVKNLTLGKEQARFIVDNWTKIIKIENAELKAKLATITENEMDFIRHLKQALDTNNDKLLEGLLKRVYKNPDMSVMTRETMIDYIASIVGMGIAILQGVNTNGKDPKDPVTPTSPSNNPVTPNGPTNNPSLPVSGDDSFTIIYTPSEQEIEMREYLNGFANAGQDIAGKGTPTGSKPIKAGQKPEERRPDDPTNPPMTAAKPLPTNDDAPITGNGDGLTSRGGKQPVVEDTFDVDGYGKDDNPLNFPNEDDVYEDEVATDTEEKIEAAKNGKTPALTDGQTAETDEAEDDQEYEQEKPVAKKDEKTKKKGFWATIGGGLKAAGKWMLRHPVWTLTIAAIPALALSYAPALALIPKLALYGTGALIASNGVKALTRVAVKPYNRFIHSYDIDKQEKKINKRMRKRAKILEKINVELKDAANKEGVVIPKHTRVQVQDKKINKQYDANAQRIAEVGKGLDTPVAGMDAPRVKRLQKLSDQLTKEEAAIVKERQKTLGKFDKVEDIDYITRGRNDLYDADRAHRAAFERNTNMDPTAANRQAVEVGRMGRKGIGAAATAGAEMEGLLRERDAIDERARKQQTAEEAAAAKKAKKNAPAPSRDDRDDTPNNGATGGTSNTTPSAPSTPQGPTKKELRARKKEEAKQAKANKKNAEASQKAIAAEIKTKTPEIDRVLADSLSCQDFWNRLETIGLSGQAIYAIQKSVDPMNYAEVKAQAQARLTQVKPKREKATKEPAFKPTEWPDIINQQLLASKDIEDYITRIRNYPDMPQHIKEIALRQNNIMNYDQRKIQVAGIVAEQEAAAKTRKARWEAQIKVYDKEIKSKKPAIDKVIAESKSYADFRSRVEADQQLLTEGSRGRFLDTFTEDQYKQRQQELAAAAKKQAGKDLKTEIGSIKGSIQEVYEAAPTLAEYQRAIDDMEKKGVISTGAAKHYRDAYTAKDFVNKANKQQAAETKDKNRAAAEREAFIAETIKKNKTYFENRAAESKTYAEFIQKLESHNEIAKDKELLAAIKKAYPETVYTEIRTNAEIKQYSAEVKKIFDNCQEGTTLKSKKAFDKKIDEMVADGTLSKEAGLAFKAKYDGRAFQTRQDKYDKDRSSLIKKHQKEIDTLMLESKDFSSFIASLGQVSGLTKEQVEELQMYGFNEKDYNNRKAVLVKEEQARQQKQDAKDLKTEIAKVKTAIQEVYEAAPTLAEYQRTIDDMAKTGVISQGAAKHYRDMYTEKDFINKAQKQQALIDKDEKQKAANKEALIAATIKKNKAYFDSIAGKNKTYAAFMTALENDEHIGNNKDLVAAVKKAYPENVYTEIRTNAEVKQYDADVKKLFDKCDYSTTQQSKLKFDEKIDEMVAKGTLSKEAGVVFKTKYDGRAFQARQDKKERDFDNLVKKYQKPLDELILKSDNFNKFLNSLDKIPGVTNEESAELYLHLKEEYYNARKAVLVKEEQEKQQKQDAKTLNAEIRQMTGNIDKLFKDGSMNKDQFDKHLENMMANGELSKSAADHFKAKYTQDKFVERDRAIEAGKKRQEPMIFNKLVRSNSDRIDNLIRTTSDLAHFRGRIDQEFADLSAEERQILSTRFTVEMYQDRKKKVVKEDFNNEYNANKAKIDALYNKYAKDFNFDGFRKELKNMVNSGELSPLVADKFETEYEIQYKQYTEDLEMLVNKQEKETFDRLVKENSSKLNMLILGCKSFGDFQSKLVSREFFGNLSKIERNILKNRFTQEMYDSKRKELINVTIKKDIQNAGELIKGRFNQVRNYSEFESFLKSLLDNRQISEFGYEYFRRELSLDKFNAKEKKMNKVRTGQDVEVIMNNYNQCIDLDKATNLVEYIKFLEKKYGYTFTPEAIETVCSKISNSDFAAQRSGRTFGQTNVTGKKNIPVDGHALRIWKQCNGDVATYRAAIDKHNFSDETKVYLKDAEYIAKLRKLSEKDQSM